MSDSELWKQMSTRQLMNDLHIVVKSEDSAVDESDLTQEQRLQREKDLLYALSQSTDYSYAELAEAMDDFIDVFDISEENIAALEEEGVASDEIAGKADIDTDEISNMIRDKLFGDSDE